MELGSLPGAAAVVTVVAVMGIVAATTTKGGAVAVAAVGVVCTAGLGALTASRISALHTGHSTLRSYHVDIHLSLIHI